MMVMAWLASLLVAVARIATRRGLRTHTTVAATVDDHRISDVHPAEILLARLSDAARRRLPSPLPLAPKPGARPRSPHTFHYNALMKAFSRAGRPDEVLRLFREMKDSDCRPNLVCYSTVIDALVVANRPHEAESVFEEMISSGLAPDVATYTILVKLYSCYLKQFDWAYQVVRWMVSRGCHPDVVTYSTLIAGLCRAGRVAEAWGVLDQMLEEKCIPNAHTYTPILQSYCSEGKLRAAKGLLHSMHDIGCPPDAVAYNIFIHGLCRIGNFDEIDNLLRDSPFKGWEPDAVTYNTCINGLCKAGRAEQAFKHMEVMLGKGLHPTTVTLNILLDCLCRESKVWKVKCILERSFELGLDFDAVSYNTVMSGLCDTGNWMAVLKLFTDMIKKAVSPDTQTPNIVINSLCKAGQLKRAKCIFESRGFVADIVTYNILIHGFYVAREIKELHLLLSDMDVRKVVPDAVTFNTVIDRLCREGRFLEAIDFVRSLDDGFSPYLVAHLAHWLVMRGKLGELLRLFDEMSEEGAVIDGRIFDFVIKAFCKLGSCQSLEINKVCLILDEMLGIG